MATSDNDTLVNLHVIDLKKSDAEIRDELMEQLETIGFLVLKNLPNYDEDKYLNACKALHALPEEQKKKLWLKKDEPTNKNVYRGYQPFKPNDPSHKEFFDQGLALDQISSHQKQFPLYEETPFPENLEWIRETFDETFQAWYLVAQRIMRQLAVGLGKPETFFDSWYEQGSLTTFRSIHYLPRSQGLVDSSKLCADDAKLTTPEHADSGFMTFLATFGYPGLQVEIDGEYKSASTPPKCLVVNVGDLLARLTGYRLKATYHRVLDIGRERYSSPMFLEPKYDARIPLGLLADPSRTSAEQVSKAEGHCFGDWLIRRMCSSYVEWQGFEIPESRKQMIEAVDKDFVNPRTVERTIIPQTATTLSML